MLRAFYILEKCKYWLRSFHKTFRTVKDVHNFYIRNLTSGIFSTHYISWIGLSNSITLYQLWGHLDPASNQYRFSAFWLRSKCSICSYQLNIWYVDHVSTSILIWFLQGERLSEACFGSLTSWPCIAVPQGSAHFPIFVPIFFTEK